jgi:hypothetical protein
MGSEFNVVFKMMQKLKLSLFLLLICSNVLGQSKPIGPPAVKKSNDALVEVRGQNYFGVISTCEKNKTLEGKCWNPDPDDVSLAEKGLENYILSRFHVQNLAAFLPQYSREYSGGYKNGRKVVFVWLNYASDNREKKETGPTPGMVMPAFSLNFDVKTGKYSDFRQENVFDSSGWETI